MSIMDKLIEQLADYFKSSRFADKLEFAKSDGWKPGIISYIDLTGEGRIFCQDPRTMRMNSASRISRRIKEQLNPPP